jgi:RNA polymerase sigma-54 factor
MRTSQPAGPPARQALALRLSAEGPGALRFLIESLNDDGYLEDSWSRWPPASSGGRRAAGRADLVHHFTVALGILQHLEPVGVGARNLGECLRLQLQRAAAASCPPDTDQRRGAALRICQQPMDLLARRDIKRLAQCDATPMRCARSDRPDRPAGAQAGPALRVDVERNIVVPDVLVVQHRQGPR